MNESSLARAALDKLMFQRIDDTMPDFIHYQNAYMTWLEQDVYAHPDYYAPHLERAARMHPDLSVMCQRLIHTGVFPGDDTPAVTKTLYDVLYPVAESRIPPAIQELKEKAKQELARRPDIRRWIDRR